MRRIETVVYEKKQFDHSRTYTRVACIHGGGFNPGYFAGPIIGSGVTEVTEGLNGDPQPMPPGTITVRDEGIEILISPKGGESPTSYSPEQSLFHMKLMARRERFNTARASVHTGGPTLRCRVRHQASTGMNAMADGRQWLKFLPIADKHQNYGSQDVIPRGGLLVRRVVAAVVSTIVLVGH